MSVQPPSQTATQLPEEQFAFRRTVLQVAGAVLTTLGCVFALSEFSEQSLAHNAALLLLCPIGLGSMLLAPTRHQQAGVFLFVIGVLPAVTMVHLFGARGDMAILYLVPVLILGTVASGPRSAGWLVALLLVTAFLLRGARWGLGIDADWGSWQTESFDALMAIGVSGLVLGIGRRRMARDEAVLREAVEIGEQNAALARRASDEKSDFLAGVSHELRTPLNAILGYTELMQEDAGADTSEDLGRVHESASRLLSLIDDVLDLTKVEAGRLEMTPEVVILSDVIDTVEGTARPLLSRRNNRFVIEHRGPSTLRVDPARLIQILLNLVSNSARFTEDGTVQLTTWSESGVVVFEVRDTGIGIAAENMSTLFQPFVQATPTTYRDFGGTGLGLSLCDRFVRQMGGHIDVASIVGEGSTFRVVLPDLVEGLPEGPDGCDA